jgi:acetoin utilization deacetylase AcuC-like enzyme
LKPAITTLIVQSPEYTRHLTGQGHPESPSRYRAIVEALSQTGLAGENNVLPPRSASAEDVLRCHTEEYLAIVERDVTLSGLRGIDDGTYPLSTGDATVCPESLKVALLAAGGVLTGVDAVMEGKAKNVFCVVRPPGHHACSNQGMGFCLFNNVAIGARYVQEKYGIDRVLIVDWDVHHGNGTQEIFEEDPTVFYFSTHREHFYPMGCGQAEQKGYGEGLGTTLNVPIPPGPVSRGKVLEAFKTRLVEAMKTFQPQVVFISAGFDAHYLDPLGGFTLQDEDFAILTKIICYVADQYAEGRLVSVLEGGYSLKGLSTAATAHVRALQ